MTDPTFEALSKLKNKTLYGWYSHEQAHCHGSFIYMSESGSEVEVSEVKITSDKPLWEDAVYVGKVTKWVRYGQRKTPPVYVW